jgi:hypothetical protein
VGTSEWKDADLRRLERDRQFWQKLVLEITLRVIQGRTLGIAPIGPGFIAPFAEDSVVPGSTQVAENRCVPRAESTIIGVRACGGVRFGRSSMRFHVFQALSLRRSDVVSARRLARARKGQALDRNFVGIFSHAAGPQPPASSPGTRGVGRPGSFPITGP